MARKLLAQIPFFELKTYIKSCKSARAKGESYELEAKFGTMRLDLSSFEGADECVCSFRRASGNGLVLLSSGSSSYECQVSSKVRENVSTSLGDSGHLDIKRPYRSRGNVELISVDVFTHKEISEVDWNDILRRCKEHTCLRLVDGKLVASEGATVHADRIDNVRTDPPEMFTACPGGIVFLGSCRVLNMDIDGAPRDLMEMPHLKEDPQVLVPDPQPHIAKQLQERPLRIRDKLSRPTTITRMLYDTSPAGFNKSFCQDDAKNQGTHVILGTKGKIIIPTKFMKPSVKYLIVVEAARLSGNGKLTVRIGPHGDESTMIATGSKKSYNAVLDSGGSGDGSFEVIVGRHNSSKGSISIHRIMILLDYEKEAHVPTPMFVDAEAAARAPAPEVTSIQDRVFSYRFKDDPVAQTSLSFARHTPQEYSSGQLHDVRGSISIKTFSSMSWFVKVRGLLPGVKLQDKAARSSVCGIDAISSANTICLEEFDPNEVPESSLSQLASADRILVCSSSNADFLQDNLKNKTIETTCRLWPFVEPRKYVPIDDYVLVFNRDPSTTKMVIGSMTKGLPRLVIVGGRGRYPKHVMVTNEYLPYPGLLHLILSARCVIDLPHYTDYESALITLVRSANVPLATSNWTCMEDQSDRVRFVMPSEKSIRNTVSELIQIPSKNFDVQAYNARFRKSMQQLFA